MKKSQNTKRALLLSALAMLLCVTMLVGATFAWFTDSASTAVNSIQSGTLDIDLVNEQGTSLVGQTLQFQKAANAEGEAILWEPGVIYALPAIKIVNNGNLWLKYKVEVAEGVTKSGETESQISLLDVIDFYVFDGGETGDAIKSAIAAGTAKTLKDYFSVTNADGTENVKVLAPNGETGAESNALTIVGHMQETAGNQYQALSLNGVAITVLATQYTKEYDSYTDQYDANAEYATPVATQEELLTALEKGEDIVLSQPIVLPDAIEITGDVTIYGSENGTLSIPDGDSNRVINVNEQTEPVTLTLSGVNVEGPTSGTYTRGISVYGNKDVTIAVDNCTASANYYAINIAQENENVTVVIKNSQINGWAAFQTHSPTKATFENCTLVGLNDKAYNAEGWNDFATVVVDTQAGGSELTFNNCTIEAKQTTGNRQDLLSLRVPCTINLNGCKYMIDGNEVTAETAAGYVRVTAATGVTINIDGIEMFKN